MKLSGVIYMHRISDYRFTGIDSRNFSMFRKLCGEETLCNVVLVTTMWSAVDPENGALREQELRTDDILFKPVLDKGAQMVRHDNTLRSAQDILRRLINNRPRPLLIQREIVDEKKDITKTAANEELDRQLAAVIRMHEEEMADMRKEFAEALAENDLVRKQELYKSERKRREEVAKIKQDRDRLSREFADAKKETDEKLRNERERRRLELAQVQSELAYVQQRTVEERVERVEREREERERRQQEISRLQIDFVYLQQKSEQQRALRELKAQKEQKERERRQREIMQLKSDLAYVQQKSAERVEQKEREMREAREARWEEWEAWKEQERRQQEFVQLRSELACVQQRSEVQRVRGVWEEREELEKVKRKLEYFDSENRSEASESKSGIFGFFGSATGTLFGIA